MVVEYGMMGGNFTAAEIRLEDVRDCVSAANLVYDTKTDKIGVIINPLTGWAVPELIVLWFAPDSAAVEAEYHVSCPCGYGEHERGSGTLDCFTRPAERKSGKVQQTYNGLFDRLLRFLESAE